MLNKQDKQWIAGLVRTVVREEITTALDGFREEITEVIADGFSEAASAKQMSEVQNDILGIKANIGSLEQRFKWISENMVTKRDFDKRMSEHKRTEEEIHKQQTKKTVRLSEMLREGGVITTNQANTILAMRPFPQKLNSQ